MSRRAILASIGLVILGVCFVSALAIDTIEVVRLNNHLSQQTRRLNADVQGQTRNREINVSVWCDAINQGRDYNRALVAHLTGGRKRYTLKNLPCQALERNTLASSKTASKSHRTTRP